MTIRLSVGVAVLLAGGMTACGHRPAAATRSTVAVITPNGVAAGAGNRVADPPVTTPTTEVAAHPAPVAASRGTARRLVPATTTSTRPAPPPPAIVGGMSTAVASWYDVAAGSGACGRKCAPYAPYTFAHRTMAFGTAVQFCVGQRCIVAHCSDRGPYVDGRTFDLSRTVFAALGSTGRGTLTVNWSIV